MVLIVVNDPKPADEDPEVTSAATTGSGSAESTVSDGSGGGDSSEASLSCSLAHETQVQNLKENWKRALYWAGARIYFGIRFETNPWFARVVAKLRGDPCLDSCELEIDQSPLGRFLPGFRMNSLDLAILTGDVKMVQKILERIPDSDNVIRGPIQNLSLNRVFWQRTRNLETDMETGILYTPLHLAVEGGDIHIVYALLEKGADVNAQNFWGRTPLDLACKKGNLNMLQQLLTWDKKEKKDPFHVAVQLKDVDFINRLSPLNVNAVDHKKQTPLHLAVEGGDSHIVDALLEQGADVNAKNSCGQTPLDLACKKGNVDMLKKLLTKDSEQKDPLHVAVRLGDVDFMKKLPSPIVNAVDHKKRTPLHYLAEGDFLSSHVKKIVQFLDQDKTLDMKALDDRDFSAFYVAVLDCNTKFVIALLDSFKDQIRLNEACNNESGPPIQIAFKGGYKFKDIERALMECDPVKGYTEKLFKDRQVYVDAANAILVGAALIASVTFAS